MRLLILFLCLILSHARLSKICEADVNNCQVSDFEFDKNFIKDIFQDLYRQACEVE